MTNFAAIRLPAQPLQDEVRPAALPPQQCAPPDPAHAASLTPPQSTPTGTSASRSCTRPATTRCSTSTRPSAGALCRAWRRSSSASSRCSQVRYLPHLLVDSSPLRRTQSRIWRAARTSTAASSTVMTGRCVRWCACLARDLADLLRVFRSMSGGCASRSGSSLGYRPYRCALSRAYECRYHCRTWHIQHAAVAQYVHASWSRALATSCPRGCSVAASPGSPVPRLLRATVTMMMLQQHCVRIYRAIPYTYSSSF
jgi:hypothetical protein